VLLALAGVDGDQLVREAGLFEVEGYLEGLGRGVAEFGA
jgi:hypothetical protein